MKYMFGHSTVCYIQVVTRIDFKLTTQREVLLTQGYIVDQYKQNTFFKLKSAELHYINNKYLNGSIWALHIVRSKTPVACLRELNSDQQGHHPFVVACQINFSFQPVFHNWFIKSCGIYHPLSGTIHINNPLQLIRVSPITEWSLTMPHNLK